MWSVPNIVSSKSRTVQHRVPRCPGQYRNVQYRVPRCPSQYRNVQVPSCPGTEMSRIPNNTQGMQLGSVKNRTPARFEYIYCTLFPFKLGHVSIPKRRIFLPLFLFCAYDSSVLQNFKIFTELLPNFSYKDPRLTEVT